MPTCVGCSQEIAVTASYCPRCGTPNPEAATILTPTEGATATGRIPRDELGARLQAALGRDFEVDEVLGEGGFAVVFAVLDRKLARRIAVKVLRPELTSSHSTIQRFVREAEAAASLTHPHILPIHFVGEGQGLVYFGMPLVEGETLEARMAREGPLPQADAVRIGAEIADALSEAHARGLVHRDVKPANVLLQGSKQRVLVTDFGIAKAAASKGDKLTATGMIIGSPHYMSPEQASGSSEIDARSDIYSLGMVMWQMLAGVLPFEGSDSQAVLVQHITQPLPSLRSRRRDASPAVVKVIERCCAKRPANRIQSAAEVAEALRAGVAPARPGRASARWRTPAAVAVGILVVAAAAIGGSQWLQRHAVAPTGSGSPQPVGTAAPVEVVQVQPNELQVQVGRTAQLFVQAYDRAGNALVSVTAFTWRSSHPNIAAVDSNGIVTGQSVGVALISAQYRAGGTARTSPPATVEVVGAMSLPPVAVVQVQPTNLQVQVGQTSQAFVQAYDAAGNALISVTRFTWRSSKPNIAAVDSDGIVTGHAPGVALITARYGTGRTTRTSDPATVEVVEAGAAPHPAR